MLLARNHHTLRLFVGSAVCISSVAAFASPALADEAVPESPPAADSTPPPADPAAPTRRPTRRPALPRPILRPTRAPPADPAPASEPAPPPPTNTNAQTADVTNAGTSVADTGTNTAAAGTNSNVAGSTGGATNPSANAGAASGTAGAAGSQDNTHVDQIATATAQGQSSVDILQVALVINLGVANGQTGANGALASGGQGGAGGDTQTAIDTGDASAVGNRAQTTVTQAAVVAGGDASTQIAAVLNIGIGVGNSGLNVAMGTVTVDGLSASQLTLLNTGSAAVQSGSADALGNRSDTRVLQSATGTASGTAVLQIGQWAIVLNFGTAFANSGGNAAVAGTGPGGHERSGVPSDPGDRERPRPDPRRHRHDRRRHRGQLGRSDHDRQHRRTRQRLGDDDRADGRRRGERERLRRARHSGRPSPTSASPSRTAATTLPSRTPARSTSTRCRRPQPSSATS